MSTDLDIDFFTLTAVPTNGDSMVPCAVKLKAPETTTRTPTHFILLLDISESMMSDQKLENCKKCATLMLNFMTGEDTISLITFGEMATLHLKRVPADEGHKTAIQSTIDKLVCDGCTNLSAGLGYVREVCEDPAGAGQKTGLLILTDGHANRGVHRPHELRQIVTDLRTAYSSLSVHCVAYGADHNEELMRGIAEDSSGSYNVVNSIEDTAFAFGEALGGLLSCAFQNVVVEVPAGTVIRGPHKNKVVGERKEIQIGDIYAGTKPLVLFDLPSASCRDVDVVRVRGMSLPGFQSFTTTPIQQLLSERDKDIELTQKRYECADILADIRKYHTLSTEAKDILEDRITRFDVAVRDIFYDGHPVAQLLRGEVATLRQTLSDMRRGHYSHAHDVMTTQHITSLGLGRGFSSPQARVARRARGLAPIATAGGYSTPPPEEDEPTGPGAPVPFEATPSAFANAVQTRIASLMRTASQHSEE